VTRALLAGGRGPATIAQIARRKPRAPSGHPNNRGLDPDSLSRGDHDLAARVVPRDGTDVCTRAMQVVTECFDGLR
jgi:hypothetical protein